MRVMEREGNEGGGVGTNLGGNLIIKGNFGG